MKSIITKNGSHSGINKFKSCCLMPVLFLLAILLSGTMSFGQCLIINGCPSNVSVNNTTNNCNAVVNFTAPTVTDNCGGGPTYVAASMIIYNNRLYYLDGTDGQALAPGFQLGSNADLGAILAANPNAFLGKTYYSTISNDCCILTSDPIINYGMTANCNSAGPFSANQPIAGGAGCSNIQASQFNFSNLLSFFVSSSPYNSASVSQTAGHASGFAFPIGTTTNTFLAQDGGGNTATCSFTVTVHDNQAPVITNPGNQNVNTSSGNCTVNYTIATPINDNCPSSTTWSYSTSGATSLSSSGIAEGTGSGSLTFNQGVTTVTLSGTDGTNSATTVSFTITVTDPAPTLTNPGNQSVITGSGICTGNYTIASPISDNCASSTTWGYATAGATSLSSSGIAEGTGSGSLTFNKGVTTVTLSGTNGTSNAATTSFTVTVTDNQAPTLSNPGNQTAYTASNSCEGAYTIASPVNDNCPSSTTWGYFYTGVTTGSVSGIAEGTGSGAISFNKGVTTVTLTGTDGTNNATNTSFTVTVIDNVPPVISGCPNSVTVNNDHNNCSAVVNFTSPTVSDNCSGGGGGATYVPASMVIFNNYLYYLDGTDGVANAAGFQLGSNAEMAAILAANANAFQGKTYYSTVSSNCCIIVSDGVENYGMAYPGSCNQAGTFGANQPVAGGAGCTNQHNISANQLSFFVSSSPYNPTTISQSGGHASGYAFPVGTTTNTFLATDPSGNTSTCSFTVTVVDAQPPVIPSCPSNITQCNHTLSYSSPSATDNCSATVSCSPPSGTTVSAGITTVVCTATDAAGNTATCSFTVTVVDLTIGITETDNSGTTSNDGIICNGFSASLDAGVHSSYSWSNGSTAESFTVSPTATTTYTVTISNGAGCTGSVSQVITVKSNPSASASVTTLIPCIGTNGVITVSASGGTSPYTGTGPFSEPNGTYSFTVSDVNGCTATTSQIITQPSQVNFTATVTNNSSCTTAHVASISVSASGGTGTKVYSDNGGTSYQGASLFSALANGSYTVVVKDSNGCVSSPSVKVITSITGITIGSTPMVNATTCTAANGRITVVASGGAGVYNYSKNSGVAWQSSNIFNLLTAGTYYIKVKDPLGCASAIDTVAVASNTGSCSTRLAENSNTSGSGDFTVYPNPASSEVTIGFSSDKETRYSVTVADMTGRIIFNVDHNSVVGVNQYEMDLSTLAKGIYLIILNNGEEVLQSKIVVQ